MLVRSGLVAASLLAAASLAPGLPAAAGDGLVRIASGGPQPTRSDVQNADSDDEPTLDQKFRKRFPQPVKVGDLIGLPVLDFDDSTIGYVKSVVRRPDGEIDLIVPYSAWFGWLHTEKGKRLVAVPIKSVAILGRQLDALEFTRQDFDDAPAWKASDGSPIGLHEKTLIALGRR
ncbi:MAG: PRC-barrel domain-containing protein [Pseudolabrys sp.]|nr:PRC-barrel domain-containing protein [Pseudolabrys sp.]